METTSTPVADRAEADFLEYRRSGDPAALARVFDQVAPELLLLAAHLTGGGRERADDAEDLLQSTFVAAIESAARYEPSRPLRAWLVGILVHMAQRERRRQLRVPDPSRLEPPESLDPARLAEDAEFAERFQRALQALPQPYRNVLTLRLVHGLRPLAIAHAHGTAPATVRSQLRRGLEILRQALPAGFAVASLLVVARGQGLAAVRAAVVAHAERLVVGAAGKGLAAAAGGASFLGVRSGVALALLLAGLAAAGALGFWFWDPRPTPPALGAAAPAEPAPRAPPVVPTDGVAGARRSEQEPAPAAAALAGLLVTIRHAGDGSPAAGVALFVTRQQVSDPTLIERHFVTDAAGEARIEALAAGVYAVLPDRAPLEYVTVPAQGQVTHRIDLPPGVDVLGKVVDPGGQPVAGAAVLLADGLLLDESQEAATSDASGLFSLRGVEPGRSLSAMAPGYRPSVLRRLPDVPGPARIKLVLDEAGVAVRGCVLDPRGAPVARAGVMLGRVRSETANSPHDSARRPPLLLWTDADGRFETTGASFQDDALPVWVRAPGFQLWARRLQAADAATELRVQLVAGARIRGVVTDADGLPTGGTHVRTVEPKAVELGRQVAPSWATPRCVVDAGGAYELAGVPEGTVEVIADHAGERLAWGRVATRAGTEPAALDLVLRRPPRIHGQVTDAEQAPLAGMQVQADPRPGLPRLNFAVTDSAGRFALPNLLPAPYTVEVWDPRSAWSHPVQSWFEVVPGDPPVALTLLPHRRASASVSGQLLDERGDPASVSVVLTRSGQEGLVARTDPETGRYALGPVPPGRYMVLARRGGEVLAASGPFQLGEGGRQEFEPLRLVRPGRLVLRAPAGSGPQAQGRVQVCTGTGFTLGAWAVARDTHPITLPPGSYTLAVGGAWARQLIPVAVRSGEDTELTLSPAPGARQALRILDALSPLELSVTDLDAGGTAPRVQVLDIEPNSMPPRLSALLARGRWRLLVTDVRGRTGEATVTVDDPARALPEIELRLH